MGLGRSEAERLTGAFFANMFFNKRYDYGLRRKRVFRLLLRKLEKFEAMLDLQKKVSQLLGISLASSEENGDES